MTKILKVVTEPSGNKFLPIPLNIGEKVIVIDEDEQYIKVRHNKGQSISRFGRSNFGTINSTVSDI